MRKTLMALCLMLSLGATNAASLPLGPATEYTKPPKPHLRFKERKGTMGFVYAAVLGPVGYFGVKLFSRHNELMQYEAGRGFRVWGLVVASAALLSVGALLKYNGDFFKNIITSLWAS